MSTTSDKTSDVRSKLEKEINNLLQPSTLQSDAELSSAIDSDSNLPVSKIVNKLNSITADIDLITDILSKCELCVLSGDKSTVTTERTTILLRDIDEKATEEDIRGLFTDPNLGPIKRIEKELANTWLVTFDSESHAKSAALQAMKKEINGNRVHARLLMTKIINSTNSNNNNESTSPVNSINNISTTITATSSSSSTTTAAAGGTTSATTSTAAAGEANSTALPLPSSFDPNSTDSYSYYTQYSQYYYPNSGGYDYNNEDLPPNAPLGMYDQNIYNNNNNNNNNMIDPIHNNNRLYRRGGGGGSYNNRNRNYNNNNNNNRRNGNNNNNNNNNRNGRRYSRGGGGGSGNRNNYNNNNRRNDEYNNNSFLSSVVPPQPILQELSFPPLASDENTNTYKEPYISYTEDEIIKIVKNYTKFSLPPNLQPGNHSAAIADKPNARLLEFQRSMSIDQALEHSRPFRFDSVDSTDYSNMIYGDIDIETLSKKPLPSSQTGVIPPPFEPKGYATVVKTGKSNNNNNNNNAVQQPPPSTSTSASAQNNNNSKSRNRTGSKDKKRNKSSNNNSNNNNNNNGTGTATTAATTTTTTTWSYFPAESSSSSTSSPSSNTVSNNNNNNQSSNSHHKSNRKGSNSGGGGGGSNKNNKGKSNNNNNNNNSDNKTSTTENKQNSWASVVTKTSPSPPKSDSTASSSSASSSKGDIKAKSDS